MIKEEIGAERMRNELMGSKLSAVISSDGLQMRDPAEHIDHGIGNQVCTFLAYPAQECKAGFAFTQSKQHATMIFADHRVHFPIFEAFSHVNVLGTGLNSLTDRDPAPKIIATIAFAVLFLAAQVSIQLPSSSFVCIQIQVYAFMAHCLLILSLQPASNLLRALIRSQLFLDQFPYLRPDHCPGFILTPLHHFFMHLLWAITSYLVIT